MMLDDLFDDDLLDDGLLDDDLTDGLLDSSHEVEPITDNVTNEVLADDGFHHNVNSSEPSFTGANYTDAEISRMRSDVEHARYEMKCREDDVHNWEAKVSLNNTKEKIANGDYANAVSRLNEAKTRLSNATREYNNAVSKLNQAT